MIQSDLRDGARLSGSRPLTPHEERIFLRHVRRLTPRNRALITAQMFLGFRISEVRALTISHEVHHGHIRSHVALPPRFLKGKRGNTRSVPIGPELRRALERYFAQRARKRPLSPTEPLFRSRFHAADGGPKPITRSMAEKIIKCAFRVISGDTQGLSSHSLRKSWAMRLYETSGHDLLIVRDGLGHRSVAVTQVYLPTARARVESLILKTDWTRRANGHRDHAT
jgi:integrase